MGDGLSTEQKEEDRMKESVQRLKNTLDLITRLLWFNLIPHWFSILTQINLNLCTNFPPKLGLKDSENSTSASMNKKWFILYDTSLKIMMYEFVTFGLKS